MINLNKISLDHWVQDEDLRKIHSQAPELLRGCKPGEAVVVTNARYGRRGENFRIVVKDKSQHIWIFTAPLGQSGVLGLLVKVHLTIDNLFGERAA
jgi:hypothetical protein